MSNINEYIDLVKATCVNPSEVDGAILETLASFRALMSGTAKEKERLGLINDFAAYTAKDAVSGDGDRLSQHLVGHQ